MDPQILNDFLDYTDDIKGYLTALTVNFSGTEEKVAKYLYMLN